MRAKMSCIIIDDDTLFIKKMEALIKNIAWIDLIDSFSHSVQGATAIFNEKPQLVLTDIDMPYVDGYALIDWITPRLRKMENPPTIIVISGRQQPILEGDDEIDGFISKSSFNDTSSLEKQLIKIIDRKS